jgi:hypothetical protein
VLNHPNDLSFGDIVYIIDIPLPRSFGQIVEQTIIDCLKNEYFSEERKSPIYQFEDCIKQINLALAELAENGNNDWVGHIHAVIALFVNNEVYLSHTGKVTGAVIRGQTYSPIFDNTANITGRVLVHKTFANLTSGQLSVGDSVILGNTEVGRHFSPQFLCQSIESNPTNGVQAMFQAGRRLHLNHLSAVVVKIENDDLDTQTEPYTIVLEPSVGGVIKASRNPSVGNFEKSFRHSILDAASDLSKLIFSGVKSGYQKAKRFYTEPKTELQYTNSSDKDTAVIPVKYKPGDAEEPSQPQIRIGTPKLQRSSGQKISHSLFHIFVDAQSWIVKTSRKFNKVKPITILASSLVLVLIVGISIYNRTQHQNSTTTSTANITQKISDANKFLDVATLNKKTNPDLARTNLVKANDILSTLPKDSSDVITITTKYNQLLLEINHTAIINPTVITKVSGDTTWFGIIGQYLFATNSNGTKITRQILGKNTSPDIIFSASNGAKITYFTMFELTRQILVATSDNKVQLILTDNNNQLIQLSLPTTEKWPGIKAATWYQQNLYVLEKDSGQIWKFTGTANYKFTAVTAYLAKSTLSNSSAIDITNDGNIYLLFNSGDVSKFTKGNSIGFGPIQIPEPGSGLDSPARIFADSSGNSIFIQDKNRIIEASKDGQYSGQYQTTLGDIKQSYISTKSKRGWILVGDSVYQFDL